MAIQPQLPPPTGCADIELLHHPETQPERQIPAQLQAARQQAVDDIQLPATSAARPYTATAAAPSPLPAAMVKYLCQYPLFRCHPRRRMSSGMARSGAEVRCQRFAKNCDIAISLAAPGLSCTRAGEWAGCVKSDGGDAFGRAGVAKRRAGTGRPVYANPQWAYRIDGQLRPANRKASQ